MVESGYTNNAIRNQKHFKPIANGNVADKWHDCLRSPSINCSVASAARPNLEFKNPTFLGRKNEVSKTANME